MKHYKDLETSPDASSSTNDNEDVPENIEVIYTPQDEQVITSSWCQCIKSISKVVGPIILLSVLNYKYLLSLEGCPYDSSELRRCIDWFNDVGMNLVQECMIAAACLSILLYLIIQRVIYRPWILAISINLAVLYLTNTGHGLNDHGYFNFWILIAFTSIFLSSLYIIKGIIRVCKSGWRGRLILFSLVLVLTAYYLYLIHDSCEGWQKGFGGSAIDNENGEARVYIPHYCELKIREPLMSWYKLGKQCENTPMFVGKEGWSDHMLSRKNIRRIGYPRTERYPNSMKMDEDLYAERVNLDVIDMDDPAVSQELKDSIEVTVDLTDPKGHRLEVDVKRNDTRAAELKLIRDRVLEEDRKTNNTKRIDHDVLIIYYDMVSRAQFHRKLPKLSAWLGQFRDKDKDLTSFEYFRYQAVAKTTNRDNNSMYYGEHTGHVVDESSFVFKYFSENGYITGMFKDGCEMIAAKFEQIANRSDLYSYDHYGSSFTCDRNFDLGNNKNVVLSTGRNSHFRRCLYGQNIDEIQLEYITQFWETYPDVRKVFRTHLSYAHEATGCAISLVDEHYVNFLEDFYQRGFLNNTQVIFVADHGAHFLTVRTPMFPDDSRQIENALPMLFHLAPQTTDKRYLDNLENNQQLFINTHDIYATLKSIAMGKPSGSELVIDHSYIHEQLPKRRDCTDDLCTGGECKYQQYENCALLNNYTLVADRINERGYFYTSLDY